MKFDFKPLTIYDANMLVYKGLKSVMSGSVTTRMAGFEWGSGFHINTVSPEKAATRMREIKIVK